MQQKTAAILQARQSLAGPPQPVELTPCLTSLSKDEKLELEMPEMMQRMMEKQ
ncbi:MAG: hypothetical protein JSW67_04015 [Candidatus Latescibacterota bacterium]|nr:MAG: hypothetical protein JSW67_04015 [Candidatus Latescibacterota bacterium]